MTPIAIVTELPAISASLNYIVRRPAVETEQWPASDDLTLEDITHRTVGYDYEIEISSHRTRIEGQTFVANDDDSRDDIINRRDWEI